MTEPRRFGSIDLVLFLTITLSAAGIRSGYLSVCCHQGHDEGPYQVQDDDGEARDRLVQSLTSNQEFAGRTPLGSASERTAHTSYLYPTLLSLLHRFADDLPSAYHRMRWIQVALGSLTAGFYFLFARLAFRSLAVGTLAGLLCAVHPFWVVNTAEINDGVLTSFLLGFCLFLGAQGGQEGGALTSLLYGLGLAALASMRAALLPFALVAVLWFLWRCRSLPRGWLFAVLVFLGFTNGLAPWFVRNFQSFGDFIPLVDSAYLHLWIGNNSRASGGPQTEAVMLQALADSGEEGKANKLKQLIEPARYRALAHDVLEEIRYHPAQTLQRRLRAGLYFFFGESWFVDGRLSREDPAARESIPEWLARSSSALFTGALLLMLLLGALGWRWSYGWRWEAMPSSLAPPLILLPYLFSHADVLSGPRLPLDGVLLCYTAFVFACLAPTVGSYLLRGASSAED